MPDQHAAFGIARATQRSREPAWRDLGLEELMRRRPGVGADGERQEIAAVGLVLRAKRAGEALRGSSGAGGMGVGVGVGMGGGGASGVGVGSGRADGRGVALPR